mgnify:CR=1 FL=1
MFLALIRFRTSKSDKFHSMPTTPFPVMPAETSEAGSSSASVVVGVFFL